MTSLDTSSPQGPLGKQSARVKDARKLSRRSERSERRLFLAEGWKSVAEAADLPGCLVEVFLTDDAARAHPDLVADLAERGVPIHRCADDAVASLSGALSPQGMVGVCRFLDRPLSDVIAGDVVVVCADVRDPGNAGTIIRTADAVGAGLVVLAGNSVDPYNDKVVRSSVGSLFHLPLSVGDEPLAVLATLQAAGYRVLAADGAGDCDLFADAALLGGKIAWLFGNEAWGLPVELLDAADLRVSIPIYGRAESLNLATAAAVCLYATAPRATGVAP